MLCLVQGTQCGNKRTRSGRHGALLAQTISVYSSNNCVVLGKCCGRPTKNARAVEEHAGPAAEDQGKQW